MNKNNIPDVQFTDASNWLSQDWLNTGGTRSKRVLADDQGREWYFKCSEKKDARNGKPAKHYKYEFWSEVIAHQIGGFLGLDILRYDVAVHAGEMGCISPLMVADAESLIEVGRFMTAINPDFLPEHNASRREYTFQLLQSTIREFRLNNHIPFFLTTILFDALIGNTDRHQENWAFIISRNNKGVLGTALDGIKLLKRDLNEEAFHKYPLLLRILLRPLLNREFKLKPHFGLYKLYADHIEKSAPVYDSGSSLGRELEDRKVEELLNNSEAFKKYIEGGRAEIHWEREKISHFQFIENLLNSSYKEELLKASSFLKEWNEASVYNIIYSIDNSVPEQWRYLCIPERRKELIVKLLSSRAQKLKELLDARV